VCGSTNGVNLGNQLGEFIYCDRHVGGEHIELFCLIGYLRDRGFERVFLAGLAFDFCVRYSAVDEHREGFAVVVLEDACRGIDVDRSMAATRESLEILGIVRATAEAVG
jgi:nicotinamidase-related amidase